ANPYVEGHGTIRTYNITYDSLNRVATNDVQNDTVMVQHVKTRDSANGVKVTYDAVTRDTELNRFTFSYEGGTRETNQKATNDSKVNLAGSITTTIENMHHTKPTGGGGFFDSTFGKILLAGDVSGIGDTILIAKAIGGIGGQILISVMKISISFVENY